MNDKNYLDNLAQLVKIKINPKDEFKYIEDFEEILTFFSEINKYKGSLDFIDLKHKNIFRDDNVLASNSENQDLLNLFSNQENRLLKVNKIF